MGKSSSIESMMNMSSGMSQQMYLHDLKASKPLNGTNAEIYKYFVLYMKERNIPITIKNLLDLLQEFSKKYTSQNLQNKFKKEIDILSSKMLKEYMFDLFKNVGLSFGVSIYYLIKSQDIIKNFKENMTLKIGAIVLGIVVIVGITAYLYNLAKNRNYYSDSITSVNKLRDALIGLDINKEGENYDIQQLIICVNSNQLSADLFKSMLDNLDAIELNLPIENINQNEILMEEILINKTIDAINTRMNGDDDEIIEIELSPQEDLEINKKVDEPIQTLHNDVQSNKENTEIIIEEINKNDNLNEDLIEEHLDDEVSGDKILEKKVDSEKVISEKKEPVKKGRKATTPKTNKKTQPKKPTKTVKK